MGHTAAGAAPAASSADVSAAPARQVRLEPCTGTPHVECGSIQVPLYRAQPALGSLTVHFRIYGRTDRSAPALEPVVAFEGGPGYGSIGSASSYLFLLGTLHRRHDLIVMDQRGTGASGAIACRLLQRGIGNYVNAVAACAGKLGPAANACGTAAIGDDMAGILAGLRIPGVDVYGDSYGTYAAQVFTIHHPRLVRAAVLDGAFDKLV